MSIHTNPVAATFGERPEDPWWGDHLWIFICAFFAIIAGVILVLNLLERRATRRDAGEQLRLSTGAFTGIALALVAALVLVGGTAAWFSPKTPNPIPGWTSKVSAWSSSKYGVLAGADAFGRGDPATCVAALNAPCYQATVMLPGRVQQVQLAYPNGIAVLVSTTDGQPLKPATDRDAPPPLLRLDSSRLGRDIARMYGLPGTVKAAGWGYKGWMPKLTGAGLYPALDPFSGRGVTDPETCPGGADACATGTVLAADGVLHPASLVTLDGKTAMLVDPATGTEFPRAKSATG